MAQATEVNERGGARMMTGGGSSCQWRRMSTASGRGRTGGPPARKRRRADRSVLCGYIRRSVRLPVAEVVAQVHHVRREAAAVRPPRERSVHAGRPGPGGSERGTLQEEDVVAQP